ncbi:heat shock protein beta-11-like [Tropilaelaps mercedesae]|uniref:Heat shock protein beta-11-like n=1 Tax=Tropilaelaps mercedesae TaxID=418985 RepID=A0A1V9XRL4_9ACAR|nr:heat shock protein beta-11-like [Tropilaelaps mercedesae]
MALDYDVTMVSSYDSSHPSENISNGAGAVFWTTTGTYPQCLVVTLKQTNHIKNLELFSCNVKELRIEATAESEPKAFEEITQQEIPAGNLQKTTVSDINGDFCHLRISILSGHEHFASIHDLTIF